MSEQPSLEALCEAAGIPMPTGPESAAVLRLARVVAHGGERKWAPIVAYAVGLAAGTAGVTDPEQRNARVDEVLRIAEQQLPLPALDADDG